MPAAPRFVAEYMEELRQTLETATAIAKQNLGRAQVQQRRFYDKGTQPRAFQIGDQVLVWGQLFPTLLWAPWRGPYPVTRVLGTTTCEV